MAINGINQYNDDKITRPTAHPPKGRIKKPVIPGSETLKEIKTAGRDYYKALNGQGDDYSVGKLNDSFIKLSSLGIGGLLSAKALSPFGKAMEFVGFGTWFAAMSIWPKAFIGTPVKALTGVDVNKKYIDSYGREKRYFEDSQYIPWDLLPQKELDKMGDKMRVPKNMKNRNEAIHDKARQVAIQSNTLWMLTAGLSTPIISSLLADQLRPHVTKALEIASVRKAEKTLSKDNTRLSQEFKRNIKQINELNPNDKNLQDSLDSVQKSLKTYLDKKYETNDYKGFVLEHLDNKFEQFNSAANKKKALEDLSKNLESFHKDTVRLDKLCNYYNATLGNVPNSRLANDWARVPEAIFKHLGLDAKKLHLEPDPHKRVDIVVKRILELKENRKLESVKEKINKTVEDAMKSSRAVLGTGNDKGLLLQHLDNYADEKGSLFNAKLRNHLQDKTKSDAVGLFADKSLKDIIIADSEIRIADAESTFTRMIRILDEASQNKPEKWLKETVEGLTNNYPHNLFVMSKSNRKGAEEIIEKHFGHLDKKGFDKVTDKIKDVMCAKEYGGMPELSQELSADKAKEVLEIEKKWLGLSPIGLLDDAAKERYLYNSWLKKVGIAASVLLAGTAVGISLMGRKNEYNPDLYNNSKGA